MKHSIRNLWGNRIPAFVHTHIHRFIANEKDFSLSLEMTRRAGSPHIVFHTATWFVRLSLPRIVIPSVVEGSLLPQLPHQLCWSIYMKHRIPHSWSIRLPVSVHTHTPFNRERKRFLAIARNDTREHDRLASSFTPPEMSGKLKKDRSKKGLVLFASLVILNIEIGPK